MIRPLQIQNTDSFLSAYPRIFLVSSRGTLRRAKDMGNHFVTDLLQRNVSIFSDFSVNPKYEEALAGFKIATDFQPNLIIALGGGTTIDMGKLISVFLSHEGDFDLLFKGEMPNRKYCPLLAVPTTFGAGAEATHFAVIYKNGVKYSLTSEFIRPDHVMFSPEFTLTMPRSVAATSAMDALCQSIESFWSVRATPESEDLSLEALRLIRNHMIPAISEPSSDRHSEMIRAAHLAGLAIDKTKTTAPHAFSYHLTTRHGIPHGEAVGIMMNYILTYHRHYCPSDHPLTQKMERIKRALGISPKDSLGEWIQNIQKKTGLRSHIFLPPTHVKKLIEDVNIERLGNHPIAIDSERLTSLFKSIQ